METTPTTRSITLNAYHHDKDRASGEIITIGIDITPGEMRRSADNSPVTITGISQLWGWGRYDGPALELRCDCGFGDGPEYWCKVPASEFAKIKGDLPV